MKLAATNEHSIPVRSIWARRDGGLDDPLARLVVEVELTDGRFYVVITELLDSNFSHCVTAYGLEAARDGRG